jgi:hypothetical protein
MGIKSECGAGITVCSEDSLIIVDRKYQFSANREWRRNGENPLATETSSEQALFNGAC